MYEDRLQKTSITSDDWTLGDPHASVTLLEYGDFECPHCAKARPVLAGLVADDPDAVKLVYRHFPITSLHPHALMAAEAAEAAGAQGRFWEMHDMLFTHQHAIEHVHVRQYAAALGLDLDRFDREMSAHLHRDKARLDFRRGVLDGVNGTPTIFVDRVRYDGPRDRRSLSAAITARLSALSREMESEVL